MKAPKKIWVSKDELGWPDDEPGMGLYDVLQSPDSREYGTPYIREDIVDGLAYSLKEVTTWLGRDVIGIGGADVNNRACDALDAYKKIKNEP